MTIDQWTAFFGWSTLVHTVLLCLTTLILIAARDWAAGIHARLFGIERGTLPEFYFAYLAIWKVGIILFALVPWVVLRVFV